MNLARNLRAISIHRFRIALTVFAFAALPAAILAQEPPWWATQGVKTGAPADDFAAANIGQLKSIASKAVAEMELHLAIKAGTDLTSMISGWATPTSLTDDYAALNIGQLKSVALLFYVRLRAAGSTLPNPWTATISDDDDFAIANIGQLKQVFSFDPADIDLNGLPDWWETLYGLTGHNAQEIAPGWITYLQKYQLGLDPTKIDHDGDGIPDGDEILFGLDPKVNDATLAGSSIAYSYDRTKRLGGATGITTVSVSYDAEGNVQSVSQSQ